jgi:hypothetical protein
MSAADVAFVFRRETGMGFPRAVWFQQFGSNSILKVAPAQQFIGATVLSQVWRASPSAAAISAAIMARLRPTRRAAAQPAP